jgi:PAS domain-containing protein
MSHGVAEVLFLSSAGTLLLFAALWVRHRFALLGELQRYARGLAEGDYDAPPPHGGTGPLRELVQALTSVGSQLRDVHVTEKGTLEAARRQAEAVIEAMPDPVLVFDGEARVARFNSAAGAALGDKLKVGVAASELGSPVLTLAAEEASVGFPVGGNQMPQVRLPPVTEGAEPRSYRTRALPLSETAAAAGAIVVLQDVTEAAAEVDLVRQAALSALVEIRPLIDALGVTLLGGGAKTPEGEAQDSAAAYREWVAVDRILRDLEAAGVEPTREKIDLGHLTEEAVVAVGLEAQRHRVKLEMRVSVPSPQLVADGVATGRLLLRTLRSALQLREPGEQLTIDVRDKPRPQIRISPGLPKGMAPSPIDAALLERAHAALLHERGTKRGTTVLQFTRQE